MGRHRKLTPQEVQQAAVDRRAGMSWRELSEKYKCAINTIRFALSDYSDEFNPMPMIERSSLANKLTTAESEIEKIKTALRKRFNLHV